MYGRRREPPEPPLTRRKRRRVLALAVGALLVIGLLSPPYVKVRHDPASESSGAAPNVVLVVTDDQRADTLDVMPTVREQLAAKGTLFTNGMVPTSLCCPSRASILTGLYAHHTRVYGNGDLDDTNYGGWAQFRQRGLEYRTLATALDAQGYRTGLFGKYLNLFGPLAPQFRPPGWDTFTAYTNAHNAYFNYSLTDGTSHGDRPQDYSTDVLAARAADFIRSTPRTQPVFVYFAPYAPHPSSTPAPRHVGATLPPVRGAGGAPPGSLVSPDDLDRRWTVRRLAPAVDVERIRILQRETLLAVDDAVGRLLETLSETGRDRDTLFVFTSDNGFFWGEHGMLGKDAPYDAATRVPLVVRWDGHVPAGVVDRRLALNLDIATTISSASSAGMTTDGLDLLADRTRGGFVLEAMDGTYGRPSYCGWRTARWLYVRYKNGRTELYDYRSDPLEQRNLAGQPAAAATQQRLRGLAQAGCTPTPPFYDW